MGVAVGLESGLLHIMGSMRAEASVLQGRHVLEHRHIDGVVAAAAADPSLYPWSAVPQGKMETTKYANTAFA